MKEKQYDPAGKNEESPAKGMASVNSFNPDEEKLMEQQKKDNYSNKEGAQNIKKVGENDTDSV
jgi:hypothetical protein